MTFGGDAVEVRSSFYASVQQDLIDQISCIYCSTSVVLAAVMAPSSAEVEARLPSASSTIQVSINGPYFTCTNYNIVEILHIISNIL